MNAVSFLSISICILSFLYVCTLLLNLKFQGDFGTIIDDSTALTSSSSIRLKNPRTGVSNTWSSKGMTSRGRGNNSEGGVEDITISYPSWYPAINATGNSFDPLNAATGWCPCCNSLSLSCCDPVIRELISIPEEDLLLLFSPPKYGYGTKLYNLKVDVKDV